MANSLEILKMTEEWYNIHLQTVAKLDATAQKQQNRYRVKI